MKRLFLVASVWGLIGAGTAIGKEKEPATAPSVKEPVKEPAKDAKASTIKDDEAVKCILARLEEQTGAKGWKVELRDLAGSSREFVAVRGERSEKGTVNVAKDYPNQGALRVYVVPRD